MSPSSKLRPAHATAWAGRPRGRRRGLSSSAFAFALVLPSLIVILMVILVPLVDSVILSFRDGNLLFGRPNMPFVGLDNYEWVFGTSWFWPTLWRTVVVTAVVMSCQVLLALVLGTLTDTEFPGRAFVRALLITPWAIPVVVAALVWSWMYDPQLSPLNVALAQIGFTDPPLWLGNTTTAMPAVMAVLVWKGLPFMYLAVAAGLQQVPQHEREAARIDGATPFQEFWHIVLPNIRYILTIIIILRTVFLFNHFELIYLLTAGGPLRSTQTLAIASIRMGVDSFDYGRAAAVTTIMFAVLLAAFVLYRYLDAKPERAA